MNHSNISMAGQNEKRQRAELQSERVQPLALLQVASKGDAYLSFLYSERSQLSHENAKRIPDGLLTTPGVHPEGTHPRLCGA